MINILIPLRSIGNFILGDNIKKYTSQFKFKHTSVDHSTGWETYSLDNEGIALFTENDLIISILSEKKCIYNGHNIIGMNFSEFIKKFEINHSNKGEYIIMSDIEEQLVYDIEDIGLQIWCNIENIILSVIVSKNFEK